MDNSIKSDLHKTIDETENEELLQAVYTILTIKKEDKNFELSNEHLNILKEREANYLSGRSKTYTWEEVKARLKPRPNV